MDFSKLPESDIRTAFLEADLIDIGSLKRTASLSGCPKSGGIYFLFDKHIGLLYIGQSKNIQRRIESHIYMTQPAIAYFGLEISEFSFILMENEKKRRDIEYALIIQHTPYLNKRLQRMKFQLEKENKEASNAKKTEEL